MALAFRKCKKDFNLLNIILVNVFCTLKTEIARFSIGFRLILLLDEIQYCTFNKHWSATQSVKSNWKKI